MPELKGEMSPALPGRPLLRPARPPPAAAGRAGPGGDRRRAVPARRRLGRADAGARGRRRRPRGGRRVGAERSSPWSRPSPACATTSKRLAHRSPTDPFKQRYTGPQLGRRARTNRRQPSSTDEHRPRPRSTSTAPRRQPRRARAARPAASTSNREVGSGELRPTARSPSGSDSVHLRDRRADHAGTGNASDGTASKKRTEPLFTHRVLPPTALPGRKGARRHLSWAQLEDTGSRSFLVSGEVSVDLRRSEVHLGRRGLPAARSRTRIPGRPSSTARTTSATRSTC